MLMYRGVNKGLYVLLSKTQAGPGRTVKQEQEEISRNHVQNLYLYLSVNLISLLIRIEHTKKVGVTQGWWLVACSAPIHLAQSIYKYKIHHI